MALLQDDAGSLQHDVHLLTIFMGIIAAAVVFGFLMMVIGGVIALGLVRKGEQLAERIEGKVTPLTEKAQALVEELTPKVRSITTNVEHITYTVRGKIDEFSVTASEVNRTVQDVNARTQAKVSRVDGMVSEALNTAHHVSQVVQEGVRKPVQQIAGIIAGLRSGLETLVERSPLARQARTATPPGAYTSTSYEPVSELKRTPPYDL
jgi:methyl-accepting chemotaxis protein